MEAETAPPPPPDVPVQQWTSEKATGFPHLVSKLLCLLLQLFSMSWTVIFVVISALWVSGMGLAAIMLGAFVALFYMPWWFSGTESRGGTDFTLAGLSFWNPILRYQKLRVIRGCNIDENESYIFAFRGYTPRAHAVMNTPFFSKLFGATHSIKVCTLKAAFFVPFLRELLLWSGLITSEHRSCMHALMSGYDVGLHFGKDKYENIGNLRLALSLDKPVIPCVVLGDANEEPFGSGSLSSFLLGGFFRRLLLPSDKPLTIIFGFPLSFEDIKERSSEPVSEEEENDIPLYHATDATVDRAGTYLDTAFDRLAEITEKH